MCVNNKDSISVAVHSAQGRQDHHRGRNVPEVQPSATGAFIQQAPRHLQVLGTQGHRQDQSLPLVGLSRVQSPADRHNAIQADIKALANCAGLRVDDRKLTVFRVITDGDDGKQPDLLIPNLGEDGRNLLVDITIGHPTCPPYVSQAAQGPLYAELAPPPQEHQVLEPLYREKCCIYASGLRIFLCGV